MIRKRIIMGVAPALLLALLPQNGRAQAATVDSCVPPVWTGNGQTVAVSLDWPDETITPGTRRLLGVRVTNTGDRPTEEAVRVVVHTAGPNRIEGGELPGFQYFGTGASYEVPAGLDPGASDSRQVPIMLLAHIAPNTVSHCDVSAFRGGDRATAAYDVVTGDPEVDLSAEVPDVSARPGETVEVPVTVRNAGPSNEYTGPTAFTLTAPAHTTWAEPYPHYGRPCTADAERTVLTCGGEGVGAPLVWRPAFLYPKLAVAADAKPGTTLDCGLVAVTNRYDPVPFSGTHFSVGVV
ncbi:hypothetical protein [Streptomyces sp. S.PB5]|uniref:hypothetical protein n=1 Tax=Streptomyces sp. S.PB5 TaxID=3020844 RepID=UPI0025AFF1A6|nr:hypothetical protein [Streptomyces sp. S.PB5]MDN3022807.1 hypothetical protein [Streptomyces sp. S.PB5]